MGNLMRQYWIPALISSELPSPDCPPLRMRLLGENMIAFRTTSGQAGIVTNSCPHRGASMFFGRNEEEGLRCVYHGWKFDVNGNCVDMPSEPAESNFKSKVRIRAYPCEERNGIIWTYMGTRLPVPPLPELEANLVSPEEGTVRKRLQECNYMQALEGDIDTIHAGFLHYGHVPIENTTPGSCYYYTLREKTAKFVVCDNEIGATYGAYRTAEADTDYWRIAHFLFPFWTMNPSDLLGQRIAAFGWVPIDDENTMTWAMQVTGDRNPEGTGIGGLVRGAQSLRGRLSDTEILPPAPAGMLPDTSGWIGRFRPRYSLANDFLIEREVQSAMATYSGVPADGQDPMAQVSMGRIYDRSHEHLGVTDSMIIRTRRRLLDAARALAADGTLPPGVEDPSLYRIRSGGAILPKGVDGLEVTQDAIHGRSLTANIPIAIER
jgi:phenylpropionate dioxygenase-like ring-hydroxylating dioxygenase large terminal subunit